MQVEVPHLYNFLLYIIISDLFLETQNGTTGNHRESALDNTNHIVFCHIFKNLQDQSKRCAAYSACHTYTSLACEL